MSVGAGAAAVRELGFPGSDIQKFMGVHPVVHAVKVSDSCQFDRISDHLRGKSLGASVGNYSSLWPHLGRTS